MDATQTVMPDQGKRKRLGLVPARIGASFAHKLGVGIPLEVARYATTVNTPGTVPQARTTLRKHAANIEFGRVEGHAVPVPVKALPGATVYLDVQDITGLEPEMVSHVRWVCRHRDCTGQKWNTKAELLKGHGDAVRLRQDSEREPDGGQPHIYYALVEIAGTPEKKDEKGRTTHEATPPTILILSDEE